MVLKINKITDAERIEIIRDVIARGANSINEVSRETGISYGIVYSLDRKRQLELPKNKRGRPNKINETAFREALENRENNLEKLCKIGNFKTPHAMWTYCVRRKINYPENPIPYKTRPEIDVLIEDGLTLGEIKGKVDYSRQFIMQYIIGSGQHKEWKSKRETINQGNEDEKENTEKIRRWFLSSFRARTEDLAKKEGWACQKAVEYLHSYKRRKEQNYSFDILYSIFKKYDEAQKKRKKLSLEELGGDVDMIAPLVCNIFSRVGLESMYGKVKRAKKVKIDAVKRGYKLELSTGDIGYFLDHDQKNVEALFKRMGSRRKKHFEIGRLENKRLTYRLASQIYEAQDAGFNEEETTELLDVSNDIVDYALTIRHEGIEKKLIKDLRILFDDKKGEIVKTLYVTSEMKDRLGI